MKQLLTVLSIKCIKICLVHMHEGLKSHGIMSAVLLLDHLLFVDINICSYSLSSTLIQLLLH